MIAGLKFRIYFLLAGIFCLGISLAACSTPAQIVTQVEATTVDPQPAISTEVTSTPFPTATLVATVTPVPAATITRIPTRTPSVPTVIQTIKVSDVPFQPGGGPGALLVLPGQLWTGTMFGGLQQWDPQTGELVRTFTDVTAKKYFDLKFDGTQLWVLAGVEETSEADTLLVISLPQGEVLKKIPITREWIYDTTPAQLGISPGKIWVNFGTVDTGTLEYTSYRDGLPSEANFAYDGEKWMWITGSWCDGCGHDLWLVDSQDPTRRKDSQNSGVLYTGTLGKPLVLANGKMWLVTAYNSGETTWYLDAYDTNQTHEPILHTNVSGFAIGGSPFPIIAADNRMVWLEEGGTLYYFDNETGKEMGQITVGEYVENMGYDGTYLWVLCSDTGLLKIFMPWQP